MTSTTSKSPIALEAINRIGALYALAEETVLLVIQAQTGALIAGRHNHAIVSTLANIAAECLNPH